MRSVPDRHFGLLFTVVFAAMAALSYFRGSHAYPWFAGASALIAAVTLAKPELLRPFNVLWMRLAAVLHRIVSPIVLGAIFFLVLTPVGIVQRLAGRDTMSRKPDSKARSYWIQREPPGPPPDSLHNQF
jgi:hypothetical protein